MKLSIITINYNNRQGLLQTIESVIHQTWQQFEYIVIDGGSTDGSTDIIKQYEKYIHYWVSEKDKGVYHAMNKGISVAKGEYLLMLNSGDYLSDTDVLDKVFLNDVESYDILYGDIEWCYQNQFHSLYKLPGKLDIQFFFSRSLAHQSSFIKRSAHHTAGLYDEKMKVCSDWKFFILCVAKYNLRFKHFPFTVSVGDTEGLSWDATNYYRIREEQSSVIRQYFPAYLAEFKEVKKRDQQSFINRLRIFKKTVVKNLKGKLG